MLSIERPGLPRPGLSRLQVAAPSVDLKIWPSLVPRYSRSLLSGEATSERRSPPQGPVISQRRTSPLESVEDIKSGPGKISGPAIAGASTVRRANTDINLLKRILNCTPC